MTTPTTNDTARPPMWATLPGDAVRLLPGLALTAAVAWLGLASAVWIGEGLLGFDNSPISGIMMAILAGLALGNLARLPDWVRPGVRFSLKRLLRLGIILLGIRLSLGDVLRLGALGVPLILLCIAGASLITAWLGRRLRLSARLSTLIGVGTSVCGATAIVAAGPAIDAREEELTYAIANITVFGILAMLLYPLLGHALFPNDPTSAGLFLGTSIHETAQVAGGGLIYAELYDAGQALDVATVTKLVRNVLMALVIPLMAYRYRRGVALTAPDAAQRFSVLRLFPLFILGFLAFALIRTVGDATLDGSGAAWGLWDSDGWDALTATIKQWAENFLAMAMAGVGLGTRVAQLRGLGLKPFYVGLAASVSVGAVSLAGIAALIVVGLR
ncbi:MAG: putative sulfate exporter family transporter [Chloroflexota bacterium]